MQARAGAVQGPETERERRWQLGGPCAVVLVPGSAERDKGEPRCVRWSGVYCTVEASYYSSNNGHVSTKTLV